MEYQKDIISHSIICGFPRAGVSNDVLYMEKPGGMGNNRMEWAFQGQPQGRGRNARSLSRKEAALTSVWIGIQEAKDRLFANNAGDR